MSEADFPPHLNWFLLLVLVILLLSALFTSTYFVVANYTASKSPAAEVLYTICEFVLFATPLLIALLLFVSPRIKLSQLNAKRIDDSKIIEFVNSIRKEMGIRKNVDIYVAPEVGGHAIVFGFRKAFIVISEELHRSFSILPHLVRPIIVHELSHIKNADVFTYEFAEAAWKSYALIALISGAYLAVNADKVFSFSYPLTYEHVLGFWFDDILLPSVLLYLLNRQISKYRELYADVTASKIDKNLITALRMLCLPRKRRSLRLGKPMILERIESLEQPFRIFTPGYWHGFILGTVSLYGFVFGLRLVPFTPLQSLEELESFLFAVSYAGILVSVLGGLYVLRNQLVWFAKSYKKMFGVTRLTLKDYVLFLRMLLASSLGLVTGMFFAFFSGGLFIYTVEAFLKLILK